MPRTVVWALIMATAQLAQAAESSIFAPKPAPWIAPNRLFSVNVPPGWGVYIDEKDPGVVTLKPMDLSGDGSVVIRRNVVPPGAHPKQLLLNAYEQELRKLPRFKEQGRRDFKINGNHAASIVGWYAYQGNVQFPRGIEEVFIVAGEEAFVLRFECFQPYGPSFSEDLSAIYSSFLPRPPSMDDHPATIPGGDKMPNLDKISY